MCILQQTRNPAIALIYLTTAQYKKAQLSLTNPHDAIACQKLLQFDVLTTLSLTKFIHLAVVASEICEIPRNSLKIQTYRVQGHPRSSILVSIESAYATSYQSYIVTLDVSPTVFVILRHLATKQLVFPTQPLFDAVQRRNALHYQQIYTSLKSTFRLVGYNSVADISGLSLFFQPLLPSKIAKSREIPIKFDLIAVQGHSRSSILVSNESSLCDFLLVINSNFGPICYCFRDIDA